MSGKVIMEGSSITTGGPLYAVKEKEDGKYNIYDYDKKKFSGQEFNNVLYFDRYFARVNDLDNEYLFFWFNEDGTVLASGDIYKTDYIPKELNQEGFEVPEDYFMIEDEDYLKVFTKTKNYQFSLDYEVMQFLKDEKFIVEKDDKYGIIDKDSTTIINFLYDFLVKLSDGYYLYELNDKYGFMNNKFEIIIPAEYDAFDFDN